MRVELLSRGANGVNEYTFILRSENTERRITLFGKYLHHKHLSK